MALEHPGSNVPPCIIKNRMASFEESLHNNAGRVPYVKGIPSARDVQQHYSAPTANFKIPQPIK
jgi:hypothetical protein